MLRVCLCLLKNGFRSDSPSVFVIERVFVSHKASTTIVLGLKRNLSIQNLTLAGSQDATECALPTRQWVLSHPLRQAQWLLLACQTQRN